MREWHKDRERWGEWQIEREGQRERAGELETETERES